MSQTPRQILASSRYGALALELIIVVVGILVAFQIDRWAENIREREQELDYLARLAADLQLEHDSMTSAARSAESRIAAIRLLEQVSSEPELAKDRPNEVAIAIDKVTWRSWPHMDAFVYTELLSTGSLRLIRDEPLRRRLSNHYTAIRHYSRVGLDLEIQHHFDRLTAGILTTSELLQIEGESWNGEPVSVSQERGIEIARALAERPEAIKLLPNIAQHHLFNQKVLEVSRQNAQEIIEHIESLIESFGNQS